VNNDLAPDGNCQLAVADNKEQEDDEAEDCYEQQLKKRAL
jgi:hypothetical protein